MNIKLVVSLWIVLLVGFFSCKEESVKDCGLEGQVIDYVAEKCGCCPGWLVVSGTDTLKFETVPENDYLWNLVNCFGLPQNIKFSYENTMDNCSDAYKKMTCVDYEYDASVAYKPCNDTCFQSSASVDVNSIYSEWMFLGVLHEESGRRECYPLIENEITLVVNREGELSGQSSCNLYFGKFTFLNDKELDLLDFGQTEMYCDGEQVWEWEVNFFSCFRTVYAYNIFGEQLWLYSEGNKVLIFKMK